MLLLINMKELHQNTQLGGSDEKFHRKDNDGVGIDTFPNGYNGDRARMVLDSSDHHGFETVPDIRADHELGLLERIVSVFLSMLFILSLILRIIIIPVPLIRNVIYSVTKRFTSNFLRISRQ
jgi:hypothetical protein